MTTPTPNHAEELKKEHKSIQMRLYLIIGLLGVAYFVTTSILTYIILIGGAFYLLFQLHSLEKEARQLGLTKEELKS